MDITALSSRANAFSIDSLMSGPDPSVLGDFQAHNTDCCYEWDAAKRDEGESSICNSKGI
jgi:hypothetical protein